MKDMNEAMYSKVSKRVDSLEATIRLAEADRQGRELAGMMTMMQAANVAGNNDDNHGSDNDSDNNSSDD